MATKIQLTYFGMDGGGPTVREAKADAGRKIEAIMSTAAQPQVVNVHDHVALVWFEPRSGWVWRKLAAAGEACQESRLFGNSAGLGLEREDAILEARKCCAIDAWDHAVADDAAFFGELGLPDRIAAECVWQVTWYRRHKAACEAGHSDTIARYLAAGWTLEQIPALDATV